MSIVPFIKFRFIYMTQREAFCCRISRFFSDFFDAYYAGEYSIDGELSNGTRAKFVAKIVAMEDYCGLRNIQFFCYLLVYQSFDYEDENFFLSF